MSVCASLLIFEGRTGTPSLWPNLHLAFPVYARGGYSYKKQGLTSPTSWHPVPISQVSTKQCVCTVYSEQQMLQRGRQLWKARPRFADLMISCTHLPSFYEAMRVYSEQQMVTERQTWQEVCRLVHCTQHIKKGAPPLHWWRYILYKLNPIRSIAMLFKEVSVRTSTFR